MIRCKNCHWLLLRAHIVSGFIEIKCTNKRCRLINSIEFKESHAIIETFGVAYNKMCG